MRGFGDDYVGTVVDLSTADEALIRAAPDQKHLRAAGVTVTTTNSAAVELKDGSSGDVKGVLPAGSAAGHWQELGDQKFPNGIYIDAGGSATGVIVVVAEQYVKGAG